MPLRRRYIAYETELEQLRQLRKQSRGIVGKKTLADYALVRRGHFIFERAARKFAGDRRLWIRWLAFCRDSDTPRQTSRVSPIAHADFATMSMLFSCACCSHLPGDASGLRAMQPCSASALCGRRT